VVEIHYVGPWDLRAELEQLLRSKGLSVSAPPSANEPGCVTESTTLDVRSPSAESEDLNRLCQTAVAEWNDKYPPFGIWIDE
jgi:hypothetical protein